jgi:2'-5' RNA ligase
VAPAARSEPPPRARLFVALDLPAGARERLAGWRERVLAGRTDLRAVAPESLHVTLAFIGHRPEAEIEPIGAAVLAAVAGCSAARLRATRVVELPPRRARLFALDLDDEGGRAAALQAAVAEALAAGGFYEPEQRPFWPHVTFARVKRGERAAPVEGEPPGDWLRAGEVTLYRSRPGRGGARYEPLVRAKLSD